MNTKLKEAPRPRDTGSGQRGMSLAKERRKKRGKIITKWSNAPGKKEVVEEEPLDEIDKAMRGCQGFGGIVPYKVPLMERLNKASKGILPTGQNSMMVMGFNPYVVSLLTDGFKLRRRIALPQDQHCNYMGLLIGPGGSHQKRLEENTGCKILVRGKGSQKEGQIIGVEEEGELHVLVVGNNELNVARACTEVERIIFSNESDRNKLRDDQLKVYREMKQSGEMEGCDVAMNTPYGIPSEDAFIIQVPNEYVGIVIGKDGNTIKMVERKSGARKIQVAISSAPGINTRNIFVEGDTDSIEKARKILEGLVDSHRKENLSSRIQSNFMMEMEVPNALIGLVIGKNGQTIKGINGKTGANVYLSKEVSLNHERKIIKIEGPQNLCYAARYEIDMIVQNGLKNLQKSRKLTIDEMSMIKPVQTYPQQFEGVSFVDENEESSSHYQLHQLSMLHPELSQILFNEISPPCLLEEVVVEKRKRVKLY